MLKILLAEKVQESFGARKRKARPPDIAVKPTRLGRAVNQDEMKRAGKEGNGIVGSNPTLSALNSHLSIVDRQL